jgi:phosphoglycolate phosphatase-like HAD superfamily hydrolase
MLWIRPSVNKMENEYLEMKINGDKSFIKLASLKQLREVDTIIFDCDGVLIDVRQSYNQTILETVAYVTQELIGFSPPELSLRETIFLFRKSGGFNIDWDTAYAILMILFSKSSKSFQMNFQKYAKEALNEKDLLKRFVIVKNGLEIEYEKSNTPSNLIDSNLAEYLKQLAGEADSSGILKFEKKIMDFSKISRDFFGIIKAFLSYPGEVGKSLLTTIFEEIFCGSPLFKTVYGQETRFWHKEGLINNEKIILKPEILDQLIRVSDGLEIGIASGRSYDLAKHSLKNLINRFNPESLFFYEAIEAAEQKLFKEKGKQLNLKKPNPFSIIALSRLKESRLLLYVGDSMEDAMMVKEARKTNPHFTFAGVYAHSDYKDRSLRSFLRNGAELIIPSVNELPEILNRIMKLSSK